MLAIAGGKGGSGKTTTAYWLGRALARMGPTLVVDTDVDAPDLHALAGAEPADATLAALGTDHEQSLDLAVTPAPAAPRVGLIDAPPPGTPVTRALERVAEIDSPVVLDTPAGAGPDVVDPLRAAGRCLLVTTATERSVRDTIKTAATARAVGTEPLGVVVTRADDAPAGIERALSAAVLGTVPRVDCPRSDDRVGRCYREVASHVAAIVEQ